MRLEAIKLCLFVFYLLLIFMFAFNNALNFDDNFQFFSHVSSMDTTFDPGSARRIVNPLLHHLAFISIILWQCLTVLGSDLGCYQYRRSRTFSLVNVSLLMGIALYFFCFLCVASEWFVMWQSVKWNAQSTAIGFSTIFLLLLVVINLPSLVNHDVKRAQ